MCHGNLLKKKKKSSCIGFINGETSSKKLSELKPVATLQICCEKKFQENWHWQISMKDTGSVEVEDHHGKRIGKMQKTILERQHQNNNIRVDLSNFPPNTLGGAMVSKID